MVRRLNDLEWGRILALMGFDSIFKTNFEKNPIQTLRNAPADLQDLNFNDPDLALFNFEVMTWPSVNFLTISGNALDAAITSNPNNIIPGESPFRWNSQEGPALQEAGDTLTKAEWGRIYARIWMDHRIDKSTVDPQWRNKYGFLGYLEDFEKDPRDIVDKIIQEIRGKNWGSPIDFPTANKTRLFEVINIVSVLQPHVLVRRRDVRTGRPGNAPLSWIVNKCL